MDNRRPRGSDRPSTERAASDLWSVVVGAVLGVVLLVGLLYVGGASPLGGDQSAANTTDQPAASDLNITAAERAVAAAINRERVNRGRPPVEYDEEIATVARNHSQDMVERSYYAHVSPEGDTAFDRIQNGPASCAVVGENIAATWWNKPFETTDGERERHTSIAELAAGLAEQWLNSQSHRKNMLDPRWERTGVGIAVTPEGEVLVTQNFCA
ncbi:hypothetical protein GRX03_13035 [Halovenus sp. WSH3]|uniref:SCP domain-containing protein n=1 Tax=Halovenus carboxidivorans TaxID=2692199 RepID=A0A6B0T2Q3_9EURY|nr:CAP domain-containing protein [Halovenus carboxidivorans]MXR52528.1 hypothetical protein [Halovenus carboxidivorans]